MVVKDSTQIKVPGTDESVFEQPSVYIKYNDNYGYAVDSIEQDRKRYIFTKREENNHNKTGSVS
jgi:hypothetical protein